MIPPIPQPILELLEHSYYVKLLSATQRHEAASHPDKQWRTGPKERLFYNVDTEKLILAYCRQIARRYWRMALTYPNPADHPDRF